jgi:hypothetical protein
MKAKFDAQKADICCFRTASYMNMISFCSIVSINIIFNFVHMLMSISLFPYHPMVYGLYFNPPKNPTACRIEKLDRLTLLVLAFH